MVTLGPAPALPALMPLSPTLPGYVAPLTLGSPLPGVTLWWCSTAGDDATLAERQAWLSTAEKTRMARFATPALARRYAMGRGALRHVLGAALGCTPVQVTIGRGVRSRPHLCGIAGVDFNVSNTRDVALIGVCTQPGVRIGVDVEHGARRLAHAGLARKFCTPREHAAFEGLDDDAARRWFLRLWTCKEAMSKATGEALGAPLRRLDVDLAPALRLVDGPPPYRPDDWTLLDAGAPDDYVATVALWRVPAGAADGRTR